MNQHKPAWGDQGDGTYRNPILNADYPDVDIERHGDRYYMIASTNHYAPGMTILESLDLVSWSIVGHVYQTLDWDPKYGPDRMDGYPFGVWAGDLTYRDGTWFCHMIDTSCGLYVSTAPDIRGPWSSPTCMLEKSRWTDPAVFWDDDERQAYLLCNFGRDPEDPSRGNQARLFRMSWDGLSLEDEGTPIYWGPGAEAAKIHKIDGIYYILMAEWRGNDRKQIVLRSRSIYGPFERRVVMDRRADLDRSCCQGSLLQTPDGKWWLTHQLVQHREFVSGDLAGPSTTRSYEGRSQWLVPVTWVDGWPVPGDDPDGTGIGKTVDSSRKPVDGCPAVGPQTNDDFDETSLGQQWEWNHNPRNDRWSLSHRPGWLRLTASVPVNDGGFWNACNTISQRIMGTGRGTATARLDLSGVQPGVRAGFCHHSGQYVLLGVAVAEDGSRTLQLDRNGEVIDGPVLDRDELYIRTDIDGCHATFSYALDGRSWTRVGPEFELEFGRWRGDRLGFSCWNDTRPAGYIDIDWFRYEHDGPRRVSDAMVE